jgi:hypothetical protein
MPDAGIGRGAGRLVPASRLLDNPDPVLYHLCVVYYRFRFALLTRLGVPPRHEKDHHRNCIRTVLCVMILTINYVIWDQKSKQISHGKANNQKETP